MNKVALSDGRWFDKDQAKAFAADYFYHPNGNPDRPICLATGSEFSSETLFLTLEGTFVLHYEDDSGLSSYAKIDLEPAARWLISNGHQNELSKLELQPEEARLRC